MSDRGYPNQSVELETYANGTGVLRTEYGWFWVRGFALHTDLHFSVDSSREIAPSTLDLAILKRAAAILSTELSWNRSDNRECPDAATKWSIYCALQKAEVEVAGGFAHRRPAAEIIRKIVDERTAARNYDHRLMDYNNDPTTHLQDVQKLFEEAEQEVLARQSEQ